ncbi:hypothetical protein IW137_003048, partial [Coemansia sp. RSA 1287]
MSGESVNIRGKGTAKVGDNLSVIGAMYPPDSALNLLSVSQLTRNGNDVIFQNGHVYVYVNGKPVLCVEEHQGLFLVMPNSMDGQERITYAPKIVEHHYEAESFPKLNEVCVGAAMLLDDNLEENTAIEGECATSDVEVATSVEDKAALIFKPESASEGEDAMEDSQSEI